MFHENHGGPFIHHVWGLTLTAQLNGLTVGMNSSIESSCNLNLIYWSEATSRRGVEPPS